MAVYQPITKVQLIHILGFRLFALQFLFPVARCQPLFFVRVFNFSKETFPVEIVYSTVVSHLLETVVAGKARRACVSATLKI